MKIFQIVNGFCHWQTPFQSLDETSGFPADCIFVESPDYVNEQWGYDDTKEGDERFIHPEPPEGWAYDEETGTFYCLADVPRMLEEAQNSKQSSNKALLAKFLEEHPLTWIDGKTYGVTMEDQSEIQLNISQYQVQVAAMEAGQDITPVLEWHAIHEACAPWTLEDLSSLVIAISNFVYPWFQKMNEYKAQIFACTDIKEVQAIELDYRTEEEIAADEAKNHVSDEETEEETTTEESTEETTSEATTENTETDQVSE